MHFILASKLFIIYACHLILAEQIEEEYCEHEEFNPSCASDEIILMNKALYGQMSLGNCIKLDVGYAGCQANVLAQFDRECSGRSACNVPVTDKHIVYSGGCHSEVSKYLLAHYTCVKNGLQDVSGCTTEKENTIRLHDRYSYISSKIMTTACNSPSMKWTLAAENGQKLNISAITLSQQVGETNHGSIFDPVSNKRIVIGDGPRVKHLLQSEGNEVELVMPYGIDVIDFILGVEVLGCPNLTPPNGAWMTRDGDNMEIGCHSGDKTWQMECKDNQWVGAVGQCGYLKDILRDDTVEIMDTKENNMYSDELSSNTLLFAIGSGLIFMSSVIFMIGVCLFKRQHRHDFQSYYNIETLNGNKIPVETGIHQYPSS